MVSLPKSLSAAPLQLMLFLVEHKYNKNYFHAECWCCLMAELIHLIFEIFLQHSSMNLNQIWVKSSPSCYWHKLWVISLNSINHFLNKQSSIITAHKVLPIPAQNHEKSQMTWPDIYPVGVHSLLIWKRIVCHVISDTKLQSDSSFSVIFKIQF